MTKLSLFIHLSSIINGVVGTTGTVAHSRSGLGKHYRHPLQKKFRKIVFGHPKTEPETARALAVKGMDDIRGPECLLSSNLALEEIPSVSTRSELATLRLSLED